MSAGAGPSGAVDRARWTPTCRPSESVVPGVRAHPGRGNDSGPAGRFEQHLVELQSKGPIGSPEGALAQHGLIRHRDEHDPRDAGPPHHVAHGHPNDILGAVLSV